MKYFIALLVLAFSVPVIAETDYIAMPEIRKLKTRTASLETRVSDVEGSFSSGFSGTNVIVSGDSKTNTIVVTDGIITSWTVVP